MSVLGTNEDPGVSLAEQYSSEAYAEEPARPGIATQPGQLQLGPRGSGKLEGQPDLTNPSMRGPPIHSSVSSFQTKRSVRDPRPLPEGVPGTRCLCRAWLCGPWSGCTMHRVTMRIDQAVCCAIRGHASAIVEESRLPASAA